MLKQRRLVVILDGVRNRRGWRKTGCDKRRKMGCDNRRWVVRTGGKKRLCGQGKDGL